MTEATHDYIGTAPCGCILAVVVDMPDHPKVTRESVADFMKSGLTIDRVTHEEFRAMRFGRKPECETHKKKEPAQKGLFA